MGCNCGKRKIENSIRKMTITDLGTGNGESLAAAMKRWPAATFNCLGVDLDDSHRPAVTSRRVHFHCEDITSPRMQWPRRGVYVAHGVLNLLESETAATVARKMTELSDVATWIRLPAAYTFSKTDWAIQEGIGERSARIEVDLIDGMIDCVVTFG